MSTSIQVSVRVRPFNGREQKYQSQNIVKMHGGNMELISVRQGKLVPDQPKKFSFDHCFWTFDQERNPQHTSNDYADQEYVYQKLGRSILDNSFNGFNGCLFAYGQTGSGKTFTMQGIPSMPGVIPRLCADLFDRAVAMQATHVLTCECQYLEIYNENVRDLLNPAQGSGGLKVRQHPKLGVFVEGVRKLVAKTKDDIEKFIDDGQKVRSVAATQMNATSSRSHAILTLLIRVKGPENELASQLHLVDLAGSERATSTGAEGATLVEGANINKSLTTLGMCLSRLAEVAEAKEGGKKGGGGHVPFRDSQLTWLLHDSLGGNSRTAMLANISPADINFEETLSTLRFAATTKKIKNHATINEDPQQKLIRELREEIAEIKKQIALLESGGASLEEPEPVHHQEGESESSADEGAGQGERTAEQLLEQLIETTEMIEALNETDEQKETRAAQEKHEHEEAMKLLTQQNAALFVNDTVPTLVTLNENLPQLCPGRENEMKLAYLILDGPNVIGSARNQTEAKVTPRAEESGADAAAAPEGGSEAADVQVEEQEISLWMPLPVPKVKASAQHFESEMATIHYDGNDRRISITVANDLVPVYLNGRTLDPEECVELMHCDRILVGPYAFRVSFPPAWIESAGGDFNREPTTFHHLSMLENYNRLMVEEEWNSELQQVLDENLRQEVGDDGEQHVDPAATELLTTKKLKTRFFERSLEMIFEDYRPTLFQLGECETNLVQMYPVTSDDSRYDHQFALEERTAVVKEQEEEQAKLMANMQATVNETDREIEKLQEELMETQNSQPKNVKGLWKNAIRRVTAAVKINKAPTKAEETLAFATELQNYEEAVQAARTWKPNGPPANTVDGRDYKMFLGAPTLGSILECGADVVYNAKLYKLRVKKGMFSRGGFWPVTLVICRRFLVYFESEKPTQAARGSLYLYGCTIQAMQKQENKYPARVVPVAPRKPGKTAAENILVFAADTPVLLQEFIDVVKRVSLPVASPRVLKHLEEKKDQDDDE